MGAVIRIARDQVQLRIEEIPVARAETEGLEVLANDGKVIRTQGNDATAHGTGTGRVQDHVREQRETLRIEPIDHGHATVIARVANEPDTRATAAHRRG